MKRTTLISAAIAACAIAGLSVAVNAGEQKEEYKAPGASKEVLLHQQGLAAGDLLEARVIRFDVPAGHVGGRHYHTGDLIVYVQSGSLTAETENGTKTYKAGEAFYETPGEVMRANNKNTAENTVLVIFQVGVQGEPLMVKAE